MKKGYNYLLDGTFAHYEISARNIERAVKRGRDVIVCYVYQDPLKAWEFTQKREKVEGRMVPKDAFINAFLNARKNVVKMKETYKDKIKVFLIIKDYSNDVKDSYFDVNIDSYLKTSYTKINLESILKK